VTDIPCLFTPFKLRSVTFANRIVVTPMCQYVARDGAAVRWHRSHHGRFALSGVGGAVVESTAVSADGRITEGCLGIWDDAHVPALAEIVEAYRDQGIPVGIQLSHSGRKGSAEVPLAGAAPLADTRPDAAWETVAPSAMPLTEGWPMPRALSSGEISELTALFGAAASRAVAAGFDFIEVHGAHGYLINSFFSPIANRRDDCYGGSLANRMRFPLEVARCVRAAIPSDMPLFYRASVEDGLEGGVTVADTIALASALRTEGVDLVDCSSGGMTGASGRASRRPSPGYLVPYAREVRAEAEIATMAVGLIVTPQQANGIIAEGNADLVAMGRQLLEEPNFVFAAARALGHPDPFSVLPESYAFFLSRRKIDDPNQPGPTK
jgi:2,4-dienoyl-CoA reductase-like NADH-dependent reductase (Old Yellow Enzyme family)